MARYIREHINLDDSGVLLIEGCICIPLLILVAMMVAQYAHICLCQKMLQYAAFSAARATMVANPSYVPDESLLNEEDAAALYAARNLCSTISFTGGSGSLMSRMWLPNGYVPGSNALGGAPTTDSNGFHRIGKVAVSVARPDNWTRVVTVCMDLPLLFPFMSSLQSGSGSASIEASSERGSCYWGYPHIRLCQVAMISKPTTVSTHNNLPANYRTW